MNHPDIGRSTAEEKVWTLIVKPYSELWNAIDHQLWLPEKRASKFRFQNFSLVINT